MFSSKGSAMGQSFLPCKLIDTNAVGRLIYPEICRILREDWVLRVRQLFWQAMHQFTSLVCQSFSQIHQSSESCQDWHGKNLHLSINRKCTKCKATHPVNPFLQVLKWRILAGKHPFIFQFKDEKFSIFTVLWIGELDPTKSVTQFRVQLPVTGVNEISR